MSEPTIGQVAYDTYAQLLQTQWPMAVWQGLSRLERYGWEAAAQAVQPPPLDRGPGQAGTWGTLAALDEARRLARAVVTAWPREAGGTEAAWDAIDALDAWLHTQEAPHA